MLIVGVLSIPSPHSIPALRIQLTLLRSDTLNLNSKSKSSIQDQDSNDHVDDNVRIILDLCRVQLI